MLPQEVLEAQALNFQVDPFRFQKFNLAQTRFLRAIKDPKPNALTIVLFLKPNRIGGSRVMMAGWSAILFGTERAAAKCSPFGEYWPFPTRSARLVSTSETLGDVGPLQKAMRDLFPAGRYTQNRGVGKSYNSAGKTDTGWTWDVMSYGQDYLSAAGSTMSLVLMSEPPPRGMFTECLTRLGGDGLMIVECTQLDLAGYLEEMAEDATGETRDGIQYGTLKLDGKPVGEIRVVRGDIEDSCREHSNGHQSHSAIEALIAGWPPEEREARKTGKPLKLSGRILPNWGEKNEISKLDDYHQDCISRGAVRIASVIDPHDRKPWFCTWFAGFPNDDVIAVAEWPPFNFNDCKSSPVSDIERYRDVILEAEASLGLPVTVRLIDGMFGAAIKSGSGMNIIQMLAAPCIGCSDAAGVGKPAVPLWAGEEVDTERASEVKCPHRLTYKRAPAYDGSVRDGNILVRAHIGESGERAKLSAMREFTPNFCESARRYSWKENTRDDRGLSEKPQLVWKDGIDTVRMALLAGFHRWPDAPSPSKIIPRRKR